MQTKRNKPAEKARLFVFGALGGVIGYYATKDLKGAAVGFLIGAIISLWWG